MPFPVKLKAVVSEGVTTITLDIKYFVEESDIFDGTLNRLVKSKFGQKYIELWIKHSFFAFLLCLVIFIGAILLEGIIPQSLHPILDGIELVSFLAGLCSMPMVAIKRNRVSCFRPKGTKQHVDIPGVPKVDGFYNMTIREDPKGIGYECDDYTNEFKLSMIAFKGESVFADELKSFSIPKSKIEKREYKLAFDFELVFAFDPVN